MHYVATAGPSLVDQRDWRIAVYATVSLQLQGRKERRRAEPESDIICGRDSLFLKRGKQLDPGRQRRTDQTYVEEIGACRPNTRRRTRWKPMTWQNCWCGIWGGQSDCRGCEQQGKAQLMKATGNELLNKLCAGQKYRNKNVLAYQLRAIYCFLYS